MASNSMTAVQRDHPTMLDSELKNNDFQNDISKNPAQKKKKNRKQSVELHKLVAAQFSLMIPSLIIELY